MAKAGDADVVLMSCCTWPCVRFCLQFKKFEGKGAWKKHLQPHAFDVAVTRDREARNRDVNGVFIGGRLIKIKRLKRDLVRRRKVPRLALRRA